MRKCQVADRSCRPENIATSEVIGSRTNPTWVTRDSLPLGQLVMNSSRNKDPRILSLGGPFQRFPVTIRTVLRNRRSRRSAKSTETEYVELQKRRLHDWEKLDHRASATLYDYRSVMWRIVAIGIPTNDKNLPAADDRIDRKRFQKNALRFWLQIGKLGGGLLIIGSTAIDIWEEYRTGRHQFGPFHQP